MELYLKSDSGYEKQDLSTEDYLSWFKSATDDEGNVKEDCLLYGDADVKVHTDKTITFIMSDDSLDRDFERFDTAGWNLKTYKKNPVLLWSHDRSIPAIGKMERVRVKDNELIGSPVFDANDELAVKLAGKVQGGIIRSGSVGFFPSKIEFNEDEKDPCKLIYRKQELREFSLCNVPANPNAVVVEQPGKSVLKDVNAWTQRTQTDTDKNDTVNIDTVIIPIAEWEDINARLDMLEDGIKTVQDMQMRMAETVVKDDNNLYEALINSREKPPTRDLRTLLDKRRGK